MMDEIEVPKWLFSKYPIVCTLCGGSFEYKGKRVIYPHPEKHYLCFPCFDKTLKVGLGRLNQRLATQGLEVSLEEITEDVKVQPSLLNRQEKREGVDILDKNVNGG